MVPMKTFGIAKQIDPHGFNRGKAQGLKFGLNPVLGVQVVVANRLNQAFQEFRNKDSLRRRGGDNR